MAPGADSGHDCPPLIGFRVGKLKHDNTKICFLEFLKIQSLRRAMKRNGVEKQESLRTSDTMNAWGGINSVFLFFVWIGVEMTHFVSNGF